MSNQPLSEQYRIAALDWVHLDSAARLQEECKTSVLSTMIKSLGDVPVTTAERDVKATPAWRDYIETMINARTAANKAKVKVRWIEMRAAEYQSLEATKRAEMKL